jgi:hypothetical protein
VDGPRVRFGLLPDSHVMPADKARPALAQTFDHHLFKNAIRPAQPVPLGGPAGWPALRRMP